MKRAKTLCATALALALCGSTAAQAAGVEVLNEGFNDVGALSEWTQVNNSVPVGNGWFQGNAGIFPAYAGAADSYAAVNFLSAANGSGTVDNWLITPLLDLSGTTAISFYTRHDAAPGIDDLLEVRFAYGDTTDPDDFSVLLAIVGDTGGYPGDWSLVGTDIALEGAGRLAFRYTNPAEFTGYVGIDSVNVVTAVPEPSAWMMLAMGLGGFGLLRRRQA